MAAPDYATEIAALEAALASGELTVEADGQRITYRSASDIMVAINYFKGKASAAMTAADGVSSITYAAFSRE